MKDDKTLIKSSDGTKIYIPKTVSPAFKTNIITDNYTTPSGNVKNRSDINAALAREWVDDNHK